MYFKHKYLIKHTMGEIMVWSPFFNITVLKMYYTEAYLLHLLNVAEFMFGKDK